MHLYESLKREHGNQVSQTIDGPIMFMDHFDRTSGVKQVLELDKLVS
jgi:hypothetical protein